MKKTVKIVIGIVVLIIIGVIVLFIVNFKKDQKKNEKSMEIIENNYNDLTLEVKNYNQIRREYIDLFDGLYYDSFSSKKDDALKLMNKYNESIKNIDKYVGKISSRCDYLYRDKNVNTICNGYGVVYEKLVNLYVGDLTKYNNFVKEYNASQNDNMENIVALHTDYIDYNKDGKLEGNDINE